ncbi:hypothetical protein ASG25_02965 [Rhizobium sp. Leaf384]|uniref:acyltransferase family protein n=1 Tax=unclassified Rhizobium TaxID=2613769 RepID=UPI0007132795|nr:MULTISPECIES: acyltransferase [unclassified Rhizobium]KQS80009.1 hypothetical protein ASG58_22655 [Rhizobium sp. Leaf383]KQS80560.1 hypothetical protein ASG25_02965 [Rhizobium sp. Leaf384]
MSLIKIDTFPKTSFAGIDALRLFAALIVMMYHFSYLHLLDGSYAELLKKETSDKASPIFHFGWVGVQIFFVISGILIYKSAANSSASRFVMNRVFRLVPAIWICAPISIAIGVYLGEMSGYAAIRPLIHALLFVPVGPWPDGVYWTLGIECVFYALVAVCLYFGKLSYVKITIFSLSIFSCIFWVSFYFLKSDYDLFDFLRGNRYFELLMLQHAPYFALGVLLFEIISGSRLTPAAMALAIICIVGAWFEIWAVNDEINHIASDNQSAITPIAVWSISIATLAWCLKRNIFPRKKASAILRFLGLITYPLYLIHGQLGILVIFATVALGAGVYLAITVAVMTCLAAAGAITYGPERMIGKYLKARTDIPMAVPGS